MKNKILITTLICLLLLIVGYASISTELNIFSDIKFGKNIEDYNVVFTSASRDGLDVYRDIVGNTNTKLEFELGPFKEKNDTHNLVYRITNNSSMYDAKVIVTCNLPKNTDMTMTNSLADVLIDARTSKDGEIKITLNETLSSETNISCNATSTALERSEIADEEIVSLSYLMAKISKEQQEEQAKQEKQKNKTIENETGIKELENSLNEDGIPVYYYYGNSLENNAIFGDLCYKIVRTTSNGGIKLIYNGIPTDGTCDNNEERSILPEVSTFNENNVLNMKYADNETDSTIKTVIDNWYLENIDKKGLTERLADGEYCNDTTLDIENNVYNSYKRLIEEKTPSLTCEIENNYSLEAVNGNALLKYKVGLITADEILYAGENSYLNSLKSYWTMTPSKQIEDAFEMFGLSEEGKLTSYNINNKIGVRPVITLKDDTLKLKGVGTVNNPYILK